MLPRVAAQFKWRFEQKGRVAEAIRPSCVWGWRKLVLLLPEHLQRPVPQQPQLPVQRMLARDPVEAVEQAKAFMARHSLADYCDDVARPALLLAQKDAERGVLEERNTKILRETVDSLSADIAHEHWVAKKEAHAAILAPAAKLPVLDKDQLALSWRSEAPLVLIGVRTELLTQC